MTAPDQGGPYSEQAQLVAYQAAMVRLSEFDGKVWQVPGLTVTAQAFLLTIALNSQAFTSWERAGAAILGICVAAASVQLMERHKVFADFYVGYLGRLEQGGLVPPLVDRSAALGRGWAKYPSLPIWKGLMWLFVLANTVVVSNVMLGPWRRSSLEGYEMSSEVIAALAGAGVGAFLAFVSSYLLLRLQGKQAKLARVEASRTALVRELARQRMDQVELVKALNEVPVVFGHDAEALRIYRAILNDASDPARATNIADLINHLARTSGFSSTLQASDLGRGLRFIT